jgi:hypothetical protein
MAVGAARRVKTMRVSTVADTATAPGARRRLTEDERLLMDGAAMRLGSLPPG